MVEKECFQTYVKVEINKVKICPVRSFKNIENETGNLTRFLVMGKKILQPELGKKKYITSFLFKLKSKAGALYSALGSFTLNGVNLTKLQSFPEKNSFSSYFFLCELDGHIEETKVKNSLEELGLSLIHI